LLVIKPWSNNYEYYSENRVPLHIASAWAVIGSKYLLVLSAYFDLRRFVCTYWIINCRSVAIGVDVIGVEVVGRQGRLNKLRIPNDDRYIFIDRWGGRWRRRKNAW
jgi:hypothetical protein